MIATHNIKVNGRWYSAGDEIPEPVKQKKPVEAKKPEPEKAGTPEVKTETVVEEPLKPKTATRRKASK